MHNTIAIICDCDSTLVPDTTEFLLKENNIGLEEFWNHIDEEFVQAGWDPPQAYLHEILRHIKSKKIKQDTPHKMRELAEKIKPYNGADNFIVELQDYVSENSDCIKAGINVEGYMISAGIEDLVGSCPVAGQFKDIFAATYSVNSAGRYDAIKSTVTFTEKTKFLYAINKGIGKAELRKFPYLVNSAIKNEQRRIPFGNMIYIGDGPSDIPCFSAVRNNGGHCIGIMDAQRPSRTYELARGRRTNYGIYSNNYSKDSDLRLMLKTIIDEITKRITS